MMKSYKTLLALTLLAFAAAPCAVLQASPTAVADSGAVKAKLKEMENAWGNALLNKDHGVAVVKDMVADDFAGVNSKGKHQNKAQLLKEMATETLTTSTTDTMDVHLYGANIATVCGTSTEKGKDKDGKAFTHRYGWLDTWMERNGKWECIGEAGMLIPEKQ